MAEKEHEAVDENHVSHVHFPSEQLAQHDSEIVTQTTGDGRIDVHLGFLQILHRYEIRLNIKDDLGEEVTFDPLQNLNICLKDVRPCDDGTGHELLIDFKANKEKLMTGEITLSSASTVSKILNILFHARVLGRGKGTPALKQGIKCVGVECDNESEQSDFLGFD